MNEGRHQFLRVEKPAYTLHSNALERIIARALGQNMRNETAVKPLLPLVNSEAHICCSDVNVTTASVAFGRWAIPKLKTELLSSDPLISKNAINSLLDMVHDPEKAVEAIRLQVIPRLVRLMVCEDAYVRQRVLMLLEVLAMQPHGKMAIVTHKTIMSNLSDLLSDTDVNVRISAAKTSLALASWYFGVDEMIKKQFIITTINRLNIEKDDRIVRILLETLELMLDQDMEAKRVALNNGGMKLAMMMENPVAIIRAKAVAVIGQMARHPDGKQKLQQHRSDILARLTKLLKDQNVDVKTQAAGALMFALCTTEAKLHCLTLATLSHLLDCAQMFRAPGLQMNSIKALTSLAESPKGQITLRRNIHRVQDIRPADEIVKRHKDILLTVINRVI
ncbi:radial spoke head 14 homolog isoform X1 [Homalodisca vitripennis]|uniref:radial spoke head 14 homolog isoform X1 n=2 Tax=Homalodisca vitripennis TaxID=197043 RepID=UPI001EEC0F3A|nr:radial spoke head 14 homolog isoform X1 [Homalodisca vitripennis]XP_046677887.1 radial spoke head 14 homolog isoform X1 [Homalodisca vitripennis]XP_046677896.1 radial spoke head 14 homolog isoform X1 [Homalodisca vitripennis]XP_046677905.1 radial spoke head 14 homolog isoform X1 [Homalodisca vitripennis]XP_046677914.1 radial spoke head 14 homolog isoform X1 [Homalodisca vitripennis]